jgi:hypothetical protein
VGFGSVKVSIFNGTVSPMKLTVKVAETVGGVSKEKRIDVDSFFMVDMDKAL